jgi:hypothetical protein
MNDPNLKDVVERHRAQVMRLRGVVGIAVGLSKSDPSKRCVQVYVTTNDWPEGVPHQLDGYEVELVKSSGFRAL